MMKNAEISWAPVYDDSKHYVTRNSGRAIVCLDTLAKLQELKVTVAGKKDKRVHIIKCIFITR